jgi:hypothetical protein
MNDSLIENVLKPLLRDIESDLSASEDFPDNISTFSPILWLEWPHRRFLRDLSGLFQLNSHAPLAELLRTLFARLKRLVEPGGTTPVNAKMILVICELIQHFPVIDVSGDIDASVIQIVGMNLPNRKLGPGHRTLLDAVERVIHISVLGGSNPVPSFLIPPAALDLPDFFTVLPTLPSVTCSRVTIKCVLAAIPDYLQSMPVEQRGRFVEQFYDFMVGFFTHNPRLHEQLLQTGLSQAQVIVDAILGWKSTPEPEHLCLLAALLPFCSSGLQMYVRLGRKHQYHVIFQGLGDFRQKREPARYSIASGILELLDAIVIGTVKTAEIFKPFLEFMTKTQMRLEQYLFSHKKRKGSKITGRLLAVWLPRYTAIEYAKAGCSICGPSFKCLMDMSARPGGWNVVVTCLEHLHRGYPLRADPTAIHGQVFPGLSGHFGEILASVLQPSAKGANDQTATSLVAFFGMAPDGYSLFSLLKLRDGDTVAPTKNIQMEAFRSAIGSVDVMASIVSQIIAIVSCHIFEDIEPFVNFLRLFFTCDDGWLEQLKNWSQTDLLVFIYQIAATFRLQTDKALTTGSPSMSLLPYLLYRFLSWVRFAMKTPTKLQDNFVRNVCTTLFLLRPWAPLAFVQDCQQLLTQIVASLSAKLPLRQLEVGSDDAKLALKALIVSWFCQVHRQLKSEKPNLTGIPQIRTNQNPIMFPTARGRIARISSCLSEYCHFLSRIDGPNGRTLEKEFLDMSMFYLLNTGAADESFAKAFERLSPNADISVIKAIKDGVFSQPRYGQPIVFWLNVIALLKSVLMSSHTERVLVEVSDTFLPVFMNVIQMSEIGPEIGQFVDSFSSLLGTLATDLHKRQGKIWSSVIHVLIGFALRCNEARSEDNLNMVLKALAPVFQDFSFLDSYSSPHSDGYSTTKMARKAVRFCLTSLADLLGAGPDNSVTHIVQCCYDRILAANPTLAWPVYVYFAKGGNMLMRAFCMDSLSILFRANFIAFRPPR